jgi:phage tail-like protein
MPLLPKIYIQFDDPTKQLKRYISAFDVILSELKSRTEAFTDIFNISTCDVKYLSYIAYLLGVEINESQAQKDIRKLIENAVFIYQRKGTSDGLRAFTEALTGWSSTIEEDSPTSVKIWIDQVQYNADPNRVVKLQLLTQYAPDYIPIPLTFTTGLLPPTEDLGDQLVAWNYFGYAQQDDFIVQNVRFQDIAEITKINLFARDVPLGSDIKVEIYDNGSPTGDIAILPAGASKSETVVSHVMYGARYFALKIIQTGVSPNEGNSLSATVHYNRTTL